MTRVERNEIIAEFTDTLDDLQLVANLLRKAGESRRASNVEDVVSILANELVLFLREAKPS